MSSSAAGGDSCGGGEGTLDRRALLRRLGAAAAAAALTGSLAEGAQAPAAAALEQGFMLPHPRWHFVFVNHAMTNPFFVPARYGIEDACAGYGVRFDWTGSARSNVGEMVAAMRRAIKANVDGIALSIIDAEAFNEPTELALKSGIPVVAYNADGGVGNRRLAYIGQDLYKSGLEFGSHIVSLVQSGEIVIFIATPGQLNIQPRVDGARDAIRDSGAGIDVKVVSSGVAVRSERKRVEGYFLRHKGLRGMFAVDAGSTQAIAEVMGKYDLHAKGVRGGGYDLLPATLRAIKHGQLDFTIDQQPYLQGFLPCMQLFFSNYTSGLVAPADTDTGLLFVTRRNVQPYLTTRTRYEGSSGQRKYPAF
ncbi:MAG: substrate-binding domain-containing protein [Gaiellaceae bacterium]